MDQINPNLYGVTFDLKTPNTPDPGIETFENLNGPATWLRSIYNAKVNLFHRDNKEMLDTIDESSVKLFEDSIVSSQMDATHEGLIQYVFEAWRKELGVVLGPDILYYTVITEIKNYISSNPQKFIGVISNIFNETIETDNDGIDSMMEKLENIILCKDIFIHVKSIDFSTQPEHYKKVLGITLASSGIPHYNAWNQSSKNTLHVKSEEVATKKQCGIPKVIVLGKESDWIKFLHVLIKLKSLMESHCKIMASYLQIVIQTIQKLNTAVFETGDVDFFKNMFVYGKNTICGSGRTKVHLEGWIRNFYVGKYYLDKFAGYPKYIKQFPSHLNCLPYIKSHGNDNKEYFFYICGLSSSKQINGFLWAEYNIGHGEIVHSEKKDIYNLIISSCNKIPLA